MLVFPAIDLLGGNAVRLEQGRRESAKIYCHAPWEIAQRWSGIGRDGMRTGPNLDATARLARHLAPCPVIASGGVSRIEDLDALLTTGATAVVIGKAFYEGAFTVEEALARVRPRGAT